MTMNQNDDALIHGWINGWIKNRRTDKEMVGERGWKKDEKREDGKTQYKKRAGMGIFRAFPPLSVLLLSLSICPGIRLL